MVAPIDALGVIITVIIGMFSGVRPSAPASSSLSVGWSPQHDPLEGFGVVVCPQMQMLCHKFVD